MGAFSGQSLDLGRVMESQWSSPRVEASVIRSQTDSDSYSPVYTRLGVRSVARSVHLCFYNAHYRLLREKMSKQFYRQQISVKCKLTALHRKVCVRAGSSHFGALGEIMFFFLVFF